MSDLCMVFRPDLTVVKLNLAGAAPNRQPSELLRHLNLSPDLQIIDTNLTIISSFQWYLTVPQNQLALFCLPPEVVAMGQQLRATNPQTFQFNRFIQTLKDNQATTGV